MSCDKLFWLHIKKSAGSTVRKLLSPYYKEVDRVRQPINFIQAHPEEYNDILNNYRMILGEYQFRRCLFAKKHLYPDQWEKMFSFAFSREPVDRCISMFYYLYWQDRGFLRNLLLRSERSLRSRRLLYNTSYAFDTFLDYTQKAKLSSSIYHPMDNHFTTHTAPMWEDITDLDGNLLLTNVFRLDNLIGGINQAFEECGIEKKLDDNKTTINKNKTRGLYTPSKSQIRKIENIYLRDFDIYEKAK